MQVYEVLFNKIDCYHFVNFVEGVNVGCTSQQSLEDYETKNDANARHKPIYGFEEEESEVACLKSSCGYLYDFCVVKLDTFQIKFGHLLS